MTTNGMSLNDMIAQCRVWLDERVEKNFKNADIINSLNAAQWRVQDEFIVLDEGYFEVYADLNPSLNPPGTQDNTELYLLPSDFEKFKRVFRSDFNWPLNPIDVNQKTIMRPGVVNNWGPRDYYVSGNSIGIPYAPAGIPIRMLYVYRVPALVLGTDVSEVPPKQHYTICAGATVDMLIQDEADTSDLIKIWNDGMARIRATADNRQIQKPRGVVMTHESW